MSSYNFLKMLKPQAQVSKNGFDMSQKHVFSSSAGMITPVACIDTVPGDYHEIDIASLTRTQTINSAAFLRGKFRYEAFFVPYVQLWHNFNKFISQRKDQHSVLFKEANFVPTVSLGTVLKLIYNIAHRNATITYCSDIVGLPWQYGALRLLDMLGYGSHYQILNMDEHEDSEGNIEIDMYCSKYLNTFVNLFRLAAYQHIFYDFYRNKYYDNDGDTTSNRLDVIAGNDGNPVDWIWLFNFDDLSCATAASSRLAIANDVSDGVDWFDTRRMIGMLAMRYSQWKKDLFTAALPSTQFGAVSAIDLITSQPDFTSTKSSLKASSGAALSDSFTLGSDSSDILRFGATRDPLLVVSPHTHSATFDVLALKKAEALQKWRQQTLRAGNLTEDQFQAHFGVKPYYDSDEQVRHLGSWEAQLQVNPVEATSTTGASVNGSVGDIAATGTSVVQGSKVKFECNDFGVILIVNTFVPESEYNSLMIDKANRLTEPFDFFTPEFENIGLEPVIQADRDAVEGFSSQAFNRVIGYAPRYFNYKNAVDKVHMEFQHYRYGVDGFGNAKFTGSMTPWVAPRYVEYPNVFYNLVYRGISEFYVNPAVLDSVFGINVDGNPNTDQFIHNCYFDIKSIRPMSVLGLPQW